MPLVKQNEGRATTIGKADDFFCCSSVLKVAMENRYFWCCKNRYFWCHFVQTLHYNLVLHFYNTWVIWKKHTKLVLFFLLQVAFFSRFMIYKVARSNRRFGDRIAHVITVYVEIDGMSKTGFHYNDLCLVIFPQNLPN